MPPAARERTGIETMVYNVLTPRRATTPPDWLGCQDGTQANTT